MSEELMQVVPTRLGRYNYCPTRGSTSAQLKKAGIVGAYVTIDAKKRPDGLIYAPNGAIKAVIEYKQAKHLKTPAAVSKAILQELGVARSMCKLLIVTDNAKTYWINAQTGKSILAADGSKLSRVIDVRDFQNGKLTAEKITSLEDLLDRIEACIDANNNQLTAPSFVDPAPLAKALWQKIWINTGKEPEKCLYNVVELFVFKFLSDLGVLQSHLNFHAVHVLSLQNASDALKLYAQTSRPEIRKLFPVSPLDQTTIINGTIFVNQVGAPNESQALLFRDVLVTLAAFEKEHGSFRHIEREFKTRLYESFLRQSAGVKALGQYFTPRNVVRAMVAMSSAAQLKADARICDPFCGVGGFLLETIAEVPAIQRQFEPNNGKVTPSIKLIGYDKGSDEKEDERTIILAKANMLIYFSDLIAKYHTESVLQEFSKSAFNKVFRLLRSNLGTFALTKEPPCDLILTNPPYVTSGVSSLREAISDDAELANFYTAGGRGTEALAIEWIIKNLALGGQALVVVPDGLLSQKGMLGFISQHCIVQAIISLPPRTFYSTPKKTYILCLTRKQAHEAEQTSPVFCYLVSEIGETRDAYRFKIDRNDLIEAASIFNSFKGSPKTFIPSSPRAKVVPATEMLTARNWMIENRWSDDERNALGITDVSTPVSADALVALAVETKATVARMEKLQDKVRAKRSKSRNLSLSGEWLSYIPTKTAWTKAEYRAMDTSATTDTPVYSAAKGPVAFVKGTHSGLIKASKQNPIISFASNGDGSAGTNFVFHTRDFYVSNDRTCLRVLDQMLDPEFVYFALHGIKETYGFNHNYKANPSNLESVTIEIPTKGKKFDLARQQEMVAFFKELYDSKRELEAQLRRVADARIVLGSA